MKKILYIITLFLLFSCSFINDEKIYEEENEKEIKVDEFLWINKEKIINKIEENTWSLNENNSLNKSNDNITNNNIWDDNKIINDIEEIENEINNLFIENPDDKINILEETSEKDIENLIDNLFENSN